jgi:excisionase family DNA binding protein
MDKRLFTVKEAAAYLALSPITLYHLVHRRQIPFVKLRTKALRFDRQDLDGMINRLKSKTVKETENDAALQARKDILAELLPER